MPGCIKIGADAIENTVIANQWCSAQRIKNDYDCQWQSYHNLSQAGVAIRIPGIRQDAHARRA